MTTRVEMCNLLEAVAEGTRLPRPGFPNLKVVITRGLRNHYMNAGRGDFVKRMAAYGISADKIEGSRDVIMMRDGLVQDYRKKGVVPTDQDAFNYSQWRGYLDKPCEGLEWCRAAGANLGGIKVNDEGAPVTFCCTIERYRPVDVLSGPVNENPSFGAAEHGKELFFQS